MSVWSTAKGTVRIKLSEQFSLKKYTKNFYDEVSISETKYLPVTNGLDIIEFELSVCLGSTGAMVFFNEWAQGIPGSVDMTCEVRVVT